ncbi:MAG: VCBS repeat-containing protein, partial [Planctomycetales bacterium]|nr:VCBS repeat-containing protein [Planctomycetales bacterium]
MSRIELAKRTRAKWFACAVAYAALLGCETGSPPPVEPPVKPPQSEPENPLSDVEGAERTAPGSATNDAQEGGDHGAVLPRIPFTNVAGSQGLGFTHESGATGQKLLPETMGGGCAFIDFDDDGDQDLALANGGSWPWTGASDSPDEEDATTHGGVRLYRNDGGAFVDVSDASGVGSIDFYAQGLAVGDFDADDDDDLIVTGVGGIVVLRNDAGVFVDATKEAGVVSRDADWTTSAGFFDYDRDGDLDLFVCRYIAWSREIDLANDYMLAGVGRSYGPPFNFNGVESVLYRNDGGVFTDVSHEAGVQGEEDVVGKALAVTFWDVDRDGWIDVLVANDTEANFFFRNRGNGSFENAAHLAGLALDANGGATSGMGIDVAFFRNTDDLAVAVGNFANESTSFYVGGGSPPLFTDESIAVGIGGPSRVSLTFGVLFEDFDLDGRVDLVETNGHLEEGIQKVQQSQRYRQSAELFWNAGPAAPREMALLPADDVGDLASPVVGRSLATADFDGDGDMDL